MSRCPFPFGLMPWTKTWGTCLASVCPNALRGRSLTTRWFIRTSSRVSGLARWVAPCVNQELPLGRWTHLAATFDGTTMKFYVDGVKAGENASAFLGPTNLHDLLIAAS